MDAEADISDVNINSEFRNFWKIQSVETFFTGRHIILRCDDLFDRQSRM